MLTEKYIYRNDTDWDAIGCMAEKKNVLNNQIYWMAIKELGLFPFYKLCGGTLHGF